MEKFMFVLIIRAEKSVYKSYFNFKLNDENRLVYSLLIAFLNKYNNKYRYLLISIRVNSTIKKPITIIIILLTLMQ